MAFSTFLFAYLLGGLTFLPLLLVGGLALAWVTLPRTTDEKKSANDALAKSEASAGPGDVGEKKDGEERSREQSLAESSASGTFAVLRRYDFQAATAAFNSRNNANGNNSGAGGGLDGNAPGDGTYGAGNESVSVYQSMYRSVFDRNKHASSTTSLLENENELQVPGKAKIARRKLPPANILFIVLRHGHLMVYESPAQVEVKHVISLAHHTVSLQSGTFSEIEQDSRKIPEPDLFIKRTAIVLTPIETPNGALQQSLQQASPKPFYLFSSLSIEKEDFYHALLYARAHAPQPLALNLDALIKLQSGLHSSSLTTETRALNALLGRVFLALHRTKFLTNFVRTKIENKLVRIQKPSFIPVLSIQSMDMGDSGPVISNLKLRDLTIDGDLTVNCDLRYTGGLSLTLLAVAKLDLGPRFKARTVDLMLKTSLQRITGTLMLRIKPPPSNRIWFTFETMPEMEIRVEPVVSERKITYGFVLRAIEERIRTAIGEGLVRPNWDDVPLPLTDTRGSHARGGLWSDEGEDDNPDPEPAMLKTKHQRTQSMPNVVGGSSPGVEDTAQASSLEPLPPQSSLSPASNEFLLSKRRTMQPSSTNGTTPEKSPSMPPRLLRSPSLSSSAAPILSLDEQGVESVRSDDASLRPSAPQGRNLWRSRGSAIPQFQYKDALEELREVRDRAQHAAAVRFGSSSEIPLDDDASLYEDDIPDAAAAEDRDPTTAELHSETESLSSTRDANTQPALSGKRISPLQAQTLRRVDSDRSSASSSANSIRERANLQQKKTSILAATAAATNAARTWGWNAIQKNRGNLPRPVPGSHFKNASADQLSGAGGFVQGQPMGRGQPLPPPGMPLPGPQRERGPWTGIAGAGVKRKPAPALPPRRSAAAQGADVVGEGDANGVGSADQGKHGSDTSSFDASVVPLDEQQRYVQEDADGEDEFGPWRQNSGPENDDDQDHDLPPSHQQHVPPPEEDLIDIHDENGTPAPSDALPRLHPQPPSDEPPSLTNPPILPSQDQPLPNQPLPSPPLPDPAPRKSRIPPPLPARSSTNTNRRSLPSDPLPPTSSSSSSSFPSQVPRRIPSRPQVRSPSASSHRASPVPPARSAGARTPEPMPPRSSSIPLAISRGPSPSPSLMGSVTAGTPTTAKSSTTGLLASPDTDSHDHDHDLSTSASVSTSAFPNIPTENDPESQALRVPDFAASAIAAENSTPARARGLETDAPPNVIDQAHGVSAEIHADPEMDGYVHGHEHEHEHGHVEEEGNGRFDEEESKEGESARFVQGESVEGAEGI